MAESKGKALKVHYGFITAVCQKPRPQRTSNKAHDVTCKACYKLLLRGRAYFG